MRFLRYLALLIAFIAQLSRLEAAPPVTVDWEWVNPSPVNAARVKSIAYGDGRVVAVGNEGIILLREGNGPWKQIPSRTSQNLYAVTWANGVFVAVGSDFILSSEDGKYWSSYKIETDSLAYVFSTGTMFAVCGRDKLLTSKDGFVWKNEPLPDLPLLQVFLLMENDQLTAKVAASQITGTKVVYMPCGMGGKVCPQIMTYIISTTYDVYRKVDDGEWTKDAVQETISGSPRQGTVCTSVFDGNHTISITASGKLESTLPPLTSLTYGEGRIVAVGKSGSIICSDNGTEWRQVTSNTTTDLNAVLWANGTFVAVGDGGVILTSGDGSTWAVFESGDISLSSLTYAFGGFIAWSADNPRIFNSTDGYNWESTLFPGESIYEVIVSENCWIVKVVASKEWGIREIPVNPIPIYSPYVISTTYDVYESSDGRQWIKDESQVTVEGSLWSVPVVSKTCFDGTHYFSIQGGDLQLSDDGHTWYNLYEWNARPKLEGIWSITDVVWTGKQFVAIALESPTGTTGLILSSPDGREWKKVTESKYPLNAIATNGNKTIIVGGDQDHTSIASSTDGETWQLNEQQRYSGFIDVLWDGTRFVALRGGSNSQIAISSDGESWTFIDCDATLRTVDVLPSIALGEVSLTSNGSQYILSSSPFGFIGDPIYLLSTDLLHWEVISRTENSRILRIKYSGNAYFGIGNRNETTSVNTQLLMSIDGRTWKELSSDVGSINPNNIFWDGVRYIGFGNGIYATSIDGEVWNVTPMSKQLREESIAFNGTNFVSVGDGTNIRMYYPESLAIQLKQAVKAQWTKTLPGKIYASPSLLTQGAGKKLVLIGDESGHITAVDPDSGVTVWQQALAAKTISTAAVTKREEGSRIFIPDISGSVSCLGENGAVLWQVRPGTSEVSSSPALNQDLLFYGDDEGTLRALRQSDGTLVWERVLGGRLYSSPVVHATGRLFQGCADGNLYCLDASTGEIVWSYKTEDGIYGSVLPIGGNCIAIGSMDGSVYLFDGADGRLIWKSALDSWILASPVAGLSNSLFAATLGGKVYRLDLMTGEIMWEFSTGGAVFGTPACTSDARLFVPSMDHTLYVLDAHNGEEITRWDGGGELYASPLVTTSRVFAATTEGGFIGLNVPGAASGGSFTRFRGDAQSNGNGEHFSAWTTAYWVGQYWKWNPDFGWVYDWYSPWVYYPNLGWAITYGSPDSCFLNFPGENWSWTSRALLPSIYKIESGTVSERKFAGAQ